MHILIGKDQHEPINFKQLGKLKYQSTLSVLFNKVKFSNDKVLSVELCPNRNLDIEALKNLSPIFCSVTWRSQPDAILQDVSKISTIFLSRQLSLHGHHVVVHLAGRNLSKSQATRILDELQRIHVTNIFVLQGEWSPENENKFDFPYASDLVKFIRLNYGSCFCIGVAAYAEAHPDSKNKMVDLKYLKLKVDSGADFIITQMIFDSETFTNFYKECREVGINVPIIPGIYVINSYENLISMAKFCNVPVPSDILKILVANKKNPEAICNYGIFQCSQLVKSLFLKSEISVNIVHFFSLNNIKLVKKAGKLLELFEMYIERPI